MAEFYYEEYVRNYEIDYYNDITKEEKEFLSEKLGMKICDVEQIFYKSGKDWSTRISGMTFNIKGSDYYPIIKKHLDNKFKIFMRKEKLKKIDEI